MEPEETPEQEIFRDIAEELTTSGVWYKFLSGPPDGRHFKVTQQHRRVFASPEYLRLYGFASLNEMPERRTVLIHTDDKPRVTRALNHVVSTYWKTHAFPEAQEVTFRARTIQGRWRWFHARIKGRMIAGRPAITSLDTVLEDLETHTSDQGYFESLGFYRTIVDSIRGFIFLKQRCQTADGAVRFEFCYANRFLIQCYKKKALAELLGHTDEELHLAGRPHNPELAREIHDWDIADEKAYHLKDGDNLIIREETFTQQNGEKLYLMTVKMPIVTSVFGVDGQPARYVLGIAFDTTEFSSLLRNVVREAGDPIYVKDSAGRYHVVSTGFRKLLGVAPDAEIEGKTFRQVVTSMITRKSHGPLPSRAAVEHLADQIEREDEDIVQTKQPSSVDREAIFYDRRVWNTRKFPIFDTEHNVSHILGLARQTHDWQAITERMWNKVPQCMCVKNSSYRVVKCNIPFAKRHGCDSAEEIYEMMRDQEADSADHIFWPSSEFPGQADRYHRDDQDILQRARNWERNYWQSSSPPWDLPDWPYNEFPEDQIVVHGTVQKLHTTKWPEKLDGEWHIVVVYSDLTERMKSLEDYHAYTVHAIKHDLLKLEKVRSLVNRLCDAPTPAPEALSAKKWLLRGLSGLTFYVSELLKFLKAEFIYREESLGKLEAIVRDETWLLSELYREELELHGPLPIAGAEDIRLKIDEVFIAEAVKEVLQNASRAILVQRQDEDARGRPVSKGRVYIAISILDGPKPMVVCEVSDDGSAARQPTKRQALEGFWREVEEGAAHLRGHRGLSYVCWVMKQHGGQLRLLPKSADFTSFRLEIPLNQPTPS